MSLSALRLPRSFVGLLAGVSSASRMVGCGARALAPGPAKTRSNRWYAPGRLDNLSESRVTYWQDGVTRTLAPYTRSGLFDDIDFVRDPDSGRWCKVSGYQVAVVVPPGVLETCPGCWVARPGLSCPPSSR